MFSRLSPSTTIHSNILYSIAKKSFHIIFLFAFLFSSLIIKSQDRRFYHYTLEDGLSQVSVHDILKDKEGYLWLATQNGLNRYDGSYFKVFTPNPNDSLSISGNFITCLQEDKNGNIWIGTENNGLCYYSKTDGSFHKINLGDNSFTVYALCEDTIGNIWVAAGKEGLIKISLNNNNPKVEYWNNSIFATTVTNNNSIWIGSAEGGIYELETTSSGINIQKRKMLANKEQIKCIKELSANKIWIGTDENAYLLTHNEQQKKSYELSSSLFPKKTIVYDLEVLDKNSYWIATGSGLFQVELPLEAEPGLNIKEHYQLDDFNPFALSNNTVYALHLDKQGSLWIGTGKYLNHLPNITFFSTLQAIPGAEKALNSNVVFSILKKNNTLWVGTSGGGLNKIIGKKSFYYTTTNSNICSDVVFSITEDHSENIWLGTKEGISILTKAERQKSNPRFKNIRHQTNNNSSLSDSFIRQIFCDKQGNIWVGTYSGGLCRFTGNIKNNNFRFITYSNKDATLSSNRVYAILQDKALNYWIGTDKGLNRLSFERKNSLPSVTIWNENSGNNVFLSNNVVYDLYQDSEGLIWIGTRNGLNALNPEKNTIKHYRQEQGLFDNTIYAILEDENGNIWASTNNGLASFNKAKQSFIRYGVKDGLQSNEFNLRAKYNDTINKELYFAGINGLNWFNCNNLKTIDNESKIELSAIIYGDNSRKPINESIALKAITQKGLSCSYNDFPFNIKFSHIDLRVYKNVDFAYRLKPIDESWNKLGSKKEIQFLSLQPGDYTLEIQGMSRGNLWESIPFKFQLKVSPPWWKSRWAFSLYVVIFLLIVFLIYRMQLRQVLTKKEAIRLAELDKVKDQLYTDITHEFRTPLSVILGITSDLKSERGLDIVNFDEKLDMIERNGINLLNLVNQMLDLSRLEQLSLKLNNIQSDILPYLRYVFDCYTYLAESRRIPYSFYSEVDSLFMDFDPNHLYKIISNLLSNAIKYSTEGEEIVLHISQSDNKDIIKIKVSDNGRGISHDDTKHIFERFYRAKNHENNTGGVGIGLALSKQLTDLMNGELWVENKQKGSNFVLQLPITQTAKRKDSIQAPELYISNGKIDSKSKTAVNISKLKEKDLSVLIVEDNTDILKFVCSCLGENYTILEAPDGEKGLTLAVENIPDIIISDVMMPKIDGFELCQSLKSDMRTSHIPIILLTAKTTRTDILKGYAAGADAYLTKPFQPSELHIRLSRLIETRDAVISKYKHCGNLNSSAKLLENDFLRKASKQIEQALTNENFKATDLAFELSLSESQLYRKIKALTGLSTALFIRKVRLDSAKTKLLHGQDSISEIAYACGFKSPAWFSRAFKEEFGVAPSDFKDSK